MLNPLVPGEPSEADVLEQTTPIYTATLRESPTGPVLPASSLDTLTLTLYVVKTDGTIGYVNSRNAQNVLNTNNVTVDANGLITWRLVGADTTFVEALPFERHIALWEWTWTSAAQTRKGTHELILTVRNLTEV